MRRDRLLAILLALTLLALLAAPGFAGSSRAGSTGAGSIRAGSVGAGSALVQDDQEEEAEQGARGIFQHEQGDGFMLDILLKRPGRDVWLNVPPDTVFHNGDRVKLGLRSNFDGYLYIVNIGTSGARRIMVPGPLASDSKLAKGAYQQFVVGE